MKKKRFLIIAIYNFAKVSISFLPNFIGLQCIKEYIIIKCIFCLKIQSLFSDQSFSYPCKPGYCSIGYSGQILGTFEDLAEACTKDHPKCKAFFYSANKGYGTLCDTSYIDGHLTDHNTCVKSPGYI